MSDWRIGRRSEKLPPLEEIPVLEIPLPLAPRRQARHPRPRAFRDPHRSTVLQVVVSVDIVDLLDNRGAYVGEGKRDIRADVRTLFEMQIELAIDELLEKARAEVPGHP